MRVAELSPSGIELAVIRFYVLRPSPCRFINIALSRFLSRILGCWVHKLVNRNGVSRHTGCR